MKYLPRRTPKNTPKSTPKDLLKWVAAAFALVATATAEYELARAIGMHEWVAAAVPGALDAYVVRALRAHREVLTAVLAMVAVNAASHLVSAGVLQAEWPLITAVSAIAPLVLWRVHALGTAGDVRRRAVWGLPWRARKAEHTSTPVEHTDAVMCPMCGGGYPPDVLGKHIRETCSKRFEHTSTRVEHTSMGPCPECEHGTEHGVNAAKVKALFELPEQRGCVWEHAQCEGWNACTVYHPEHATELTGTPPSTDQARVHAQTAAWGDDWLDVHDAVNPPSTPPVPVHAPYDDHVHAENTSTPALRLVKDTSTEPEHTSTPLCPACEHNVHTARECDSGFCDCVHHLPDREHWCGSGSTHARHTYEGGTVCLGVLDGRYAAEHTASTRTADDWNLEHVSTGVLEPDDVEHMERARELFHTIGGVPPFRALKEGTPGMGTERARRLRAALKAEHATSTPSTDGAHT